MLLLQLINSQKQESTQFHQQHPIPQVVAQRKRPIISQLSNWTS